MFPASRRLSVTSTKPIEIPGRRRATAPALSLSPCRGSSAFSPDLIFEMSPASPRLEETTTQKPSQRTSPSKEHYLYPIPIFPSSHFAQPIRSATKPPSKTQEHIPFPLDVGAWPQPPSNFLPTPASHPNSTPPVIKGPAKQKITGFTPLYPSPVSDGTSSRRRDRGSQSSKSSPWTRRRDEDTVEAFMRRGTAELSDRTARRRGEARQPFHRSPNVHLVLGH